ncbi:MAG: hypothetical protein HYX81_00565 [Chloroflexi bacterium]|nr:hypothetical protein [Chloroflexota bacterium]
MEVYKIPLAQKESILLDYVLTLQHWDPHYLEELMTKYLAIRESNARVLTGVTSYLEVDDSPVFDEVIAMVPPLFVIGGEEVGFSLKTKLYRARYSLEKEVEDARKNRPYDEA